MMTRLPVRTRAVIVVAIVVVMTETVAVIAVETEAVMVAETVVVMAVIAVTTVVIVVIVATKTAQKVKVQKAPKAGMARTPTLVPALVAKPMKVGYLISSRINLTGINWPSKIPYRYEYQLISPTYVK